MKLVKKTVAALAVSALLLTGCNLVPPENVPTVPTKPSGAPTQPLVPTQPTQPQVGDQSMNMLSAARVSEIEDAWLLTTNVPLGEWCEDDGDSYTDGVRYYGSYGGYDILFRPTGDDAITELEVGDLTFEHRCGFEVYAYRDGSFTPLQELYSQGKLTGGHLIELAALHRAYEGRTVGALGPALTADALELMKLAFLKKYAPDGKYTTRDLTVVYYGQYGDAHVGFINGIMAYTQALTSDNIDGVIFRYNTGQKLQVYFKGELMGLGEAYDRGILTQEHLIALHKAYTPKDDNLVTE